MNDMRVRIVGGGPAGLYFAYLLKRDRPGHDVHVIEKNPRDATFGFGVVFSDRALEFLRKDDEDTYQYLMPHMEYWPDLKIFHKDEPIPIDGNGFAAIGRLDFLNLLQARCEHIGVRLSFNSTVRSMDELSNADLVVAANGANSFIRQMYSKEFGSSERRLRNPFIWFGTTKPFDCLSLTFRQNDDGVFCAHHYRYSPKRSTFIVETNQATYERAGLKGLSDRETRAYCETVFAEDLEGHSLLSNKSIWRWFPQVWNQRWSFNNIVLVGDALHTAHFSIGSGTRLAMEDAIALFKAINAHPDDQATAFAHFEKKRRPTLEKLVDAAAASASWYERMAEAMHNFKPYEFAHSYMTRTGRISDDKLKELAPQFMARYTKAKAILTAGGAPSRR